MTNIGKIIGDEYKTLMPDLSDDADIQQALEMYHYGQANYDPNTPTVANSIEGHLGDLQDQIDVLSLRPGGGGEVKATEPIVTATGQPIPDGYIWVDSDADATQITPIYPTVIFSSVQPTGWGIQQKGNIWINESSDTGVLNVNVYALLSPTSTQTISNTILSSPTINTPTASGGTYSSPIINSGIFTAPEENWNISATAVTTTTNVDYLTSQNWYYTTASTAGASTINIRGNNSTALSSIINIGQSITLSTGVTTGATTPAYFNTIQVDGTAVGVSARWQYAAIPTSGTTSGVDMYSFTVLRTGSSTYTVFASVCRW